MKPLAVRFGTAIALALSTAMVAAQAPPATVDGLVSAAKTAAGTDWAGTFLRLCIVPAPTAPGAGGGGTAGPPPRDTWYAEPAKVADNLYFLGTKVHSAWALVGSDGIIVLEALFDYAAPDEVVGGMKKLGLDPAKVKYVVISHAHSDHDGGARYLQDTLTNARVVYAGPDWDAVDKSTNHQGGKPRHDLVGENGMRLSVGDASVQLVTMPGHTPGTLSFLFDARDNGKPLKIAYVGGTAIPFNGDAGYYDLYLASSRKMAKAAADFGATALLSNHTEFDSAFYKAHAADDRKPGEANPFEVGKAAVAKYFTVVDDCATAAKLRAAKQ